MLVQYLLVSLFIPLLAATHAPNPRMRKRHTRPDLAVRGSHSLSKRFDNTRFTFYAAGLGACGQTNTDSDFIVALNSAQWDGGSHCGQTISITVNGKTTQATIMDQCPGCPWGGLDFTPGLFSFFGDQSLGVLTGSWSFGGGDPQPSPSPSSTWSPPPSSIWTPTSTSTPPPPPSTTSSSRSSSSSSSSSWSSSSSSSSSSTSTFSSSSSSEAPSATPSIDTNDLLPQLYLAIGQMGGLVLAAEQAQ